MSFLILGGTHDTFGSDGVGHVHGVYPLLKSRKKLVETLEGRTMSPGEGFSETHPD